MRSGPSRREKWKGRVLKSPALTHGTRLFLVHTLAKHMAADGFVSFPRRRLAAEHGVSERQAARYIANRPLPRGRGVMCVGPSFPLQGCENGGFNYTKRPLGGVDAPLVQGASPTKQESTNG